MQQISAGAEFDVANFDKPAKRKAKVGEADLDRRQKRLREQLDEILEEQYQRLFGRKQSKHHRSYEANSAEKSVEPSEERSGIRLFKERDPSTALPPSESPSAPGPKRKKKQKQKVYISDGIPRFQGLAVLETEDILRAAENSRRLGERNLAETSPRSQNSKE